MYIHRLISAVALLSSIVTGLVPLTQSLEPRRFYLLPFEPCPVGYYRGLHDECNMCVYDCSEEQESIIGNVADLLFLPIKLAFNTIETFDQSFFDFVDGQTCEAVSEFAIPVVHAIITEVINKPEFEDIFNKIQSEITVFLKTPSIHEGWKFLNTRLEDIPVIGEVISTFGTAEDWIYEKIVPAFAQEKIQACIQDGLADPAHDPFFFILGLAVNMVRHPTIFDLLITLPGIGKLTGDMIAGSGGFKTVEAIGMTTGSDEGVRSTEKTDKHKPIRHESGMKNTTEKIEEKSKSKDRLKKIGNKKKINCPRGGHLSCVGFKNKPENHEEALPSPWVGLPTVAELVANIRERGLTQGLNAVFYSRLLDKQDLILAKTWYTENIISRGGRGSVVYDNLQNSLWSQRQRLVLNADEQREYVKRLSQALAETAEGKVYFFTRKQFNDTDYHLDSIWRAWEYPALTRNKDVTEIMQVDATEKGDLGHQIWTPEKGETPYPPRTSS